MGESIKVDELIEGGRFYELREIIVGEYWICNKVLQVLMNMFLEILLLYATL